MLQLQWNNAVEDIIDIEVINSLRKYKNIVIFGAGESGGWVVHLLRHFNIEPKCYCDNYSDKWGKEKDGLRIFSFEDAIGKYRDAAVCIASMWSEEIFKQIKSFDPAIAARTWDLLTTMAWETSELSYQSSEGVFIRDNLDKFEQLYNRLADDISKNTLEGILNYRLTRNKGYLKKIISSENVYFDKTLIKNIPIDREIIDGGTFDGDTVEKLINLVCVGEGKKVCLKIHCYEADEKNYNKLKENTLKKEWEKHSIVLHNAALWNSSREIIQFCGNGLSSKICKNNDDIIKKYISEAIDDYQYENVGFIKMDIEGAEREALNGGKKTICRDMPMLAICAYHLQDDLLVLPDTIDVISSDYLLYLRHYMYSSGDTILYGIPRLGVEWNG